MESWTAVLAVYLFGGVTFIPLIVAAVLAHGYYTFPRRHDVGSPGTDKEADDIVQPGDDTPLLEAAKDAAEELKSRTNHQDFDVAAGYFAVCREYTPMGINAKPIERPTPMGSATVASPSPSVYQTMYRSIFDRKPVAGPLESNSLSQRPKKAGNVFYVVLRHGHLMLFDDEEQLEVRHVISLAHHDISIYSGGDTTPEGELFIKRNALCLSRKLDGANQAPDSQVSKPFYLFSENCSAKEDFYFALLKNQEQTFGSDNSPPGPMQFDVKNMISLVQRLHSSEDHLNFRWLNAILGRIFLGIYKTRDLENFIREKITKKIARVKRPSFLTNITIQRIDTGEAAPYFTNLKLKDLTVEGECVVEADIKYSGNSRIEVAATAKLDLGTRFKAREVNLVLAVVLKRVEGHVLFKIKAPPSNRVWLSFQTMPKMEMAIEPIVSSRQITYTVILRQIENRIKEVFAETLVQPFWDDMPFFKTEHKTWRGGIFEGDDAIESSSENLETAVDQVADSASVDREEEKLDSLDETRPIEKSHSLPVLDAQPEKTGLFGRKANKGANQSTTSVASSGADAKVPSASPVRLPNIVKNSTDPIVGTETTHADLFKPSSSPPDHATNFMAALHSRSQDASPAVTPLGSPGKTGSVRKTPSQSSASSKDEVHNETDEETRTTPIHAGRRNTASSADSSNYGDNSTASSPTPSTPSSFKSQAGSLSRNFFMRRENTTNTTPAETSNGDLKRNTLAAVTNVAVQARQWGWNALQRQKDARRADQAAQVDLSKPMGRGQPLPPPGVPLPGPSNGRTKVGPMPTPRRKPVPGQPITDAHEAEKESASRPVPAPPLPQRRRRGASQEQEGDVEQNILVVAAPEPDDSQPGTPAIEDDKVNYNAPWTETANATERAASAEAGTPEVAGSVTRTSESSLSDDKLEPSKPIVALPAAAAAGAEDDDDDYSGWMEDDAFDDEQTGETLPASVAGQTSQEASSDE